MAIKTIARIATGAATSGIAGLPLTGAVPASAINQLESGGRKRRLGVVIGAAGLVAAPLVLFGGVAQAAAPSSVWIEVGVLRVQSPAGQVNAISLTPTPIGAQVLVRDTVGNLAAQFPCLPVDGHTVRCPGGAIRSYVVDTSDRNDRFSSTVNRPGTIRTGAGDDRVSDGPNNQTIDLGSGNDVAFLGLGRDVVIGGSGVDQASYQGRAAAVSVSLDSLANDGQPGERDNIRIDRGGVENAVGGSGNDILIGSAAANNLRGLNGRDRISGGAGNDALLGNDGDDVLNGAAGSDTINGGTGADNMFGGPGIDTVSYAGRAIKVSVGLDSVANDGQFGERDNARSDLENIDGGNGSDTLVGNAAQNVIRGANGNDTMRGLGGNDRLLGGNGVDSASGGPGADVCEAEIRSSC